MSSETPNAALDKNSEPALMIEVQRIYVKEQSCKVPHGSQAFQQQNANFEMTTEMSINHQTFGKDAWEINLNISLTAKANQSTVYVSHVQQTCMMKTSCTEDKQLSHLMNVYIPSILYPYVRKVIADAVFNAGFPPVFLPHVDFAMMYEKRTQKEDIALAAPTSLHNENLVH